LTLWFYFVSIFLYVILSWVGQRQYNPIGAILGEIVEPVLRPARRILPPIAGLDLAPLLVLILLQAAAIALPLPGLR
jgi:YggT family protein